MLKNIWGRGEKKLGDHYKEQIVWIKAWEYSDIQIRSIRMKKLKINRKLSKIDVRTDKNILKYTIEKIVKQIKLEWKQGKKR